MQHKQLPPGTNGLPFIGETLHFLLERKFIQRRHKKHGSIYRTHLLGKPTIVAGGPEAARTILSTHMDHFSWREGWPDTFKELIGNAMFIQDGATHKRQRTMLLPAFHGRALASYFDTINSAIQNYSSVWHSQGEIRWYPENRKLTFEIACRVLLGTIPDRDVTQLSHAFDRLTKGFFVVNRLRNRWTTYGKALAARKQIVAYIEEVIKAKQANPGSDALSLMLAARDEDGKALSYAELIDQSILLLFAGHDTTASMMTSIFLELSRHPDVLAKARAEQDQLAAQGPLSTEQLREMPYLEQILREIERLHPPVPGGFRGVIKPVTIEGYTIPAGWQLIYSILITHHTDSIYPASEEFDPDRFSAGSEQHKQQAFSLIGFGGGPRICLGMSFALMELKMTAAHILRNYEWTLLPNQDLQMNLVPTRRPKDELQVFIQHRKS